MQHATVVYSQALNLCCSASSDAASSLIFTHLLIFVIACRYQSGWVPLVRSVVRTEGKHDQSIRVNAARG